MTAVEKEVEDDIAGLLAGLALQDATETSKQQKQQEGAPPPPAATRLDANCAALQAELDRAGFQIFECISDKGYLTWKPPRSTEPTYQDLSSITTAEEITRYIDREGKPDKLVRTSSISLPQAFSKLAPREYANQFPYGQHEIASLHVAVQDRGVDLHDIDFVFGGSTLEMLANCDNDNPYMLTRIAGTRAIIITKQKKYVADFSTFGFQFERLMTGKDLDDLSEVVDSVEHMQVMKVGGKYRVLFLAETDAVLADHGPPVEVKASSPYHWGTKVMFQMISSGSTKLCHGVKGGRGKLLTRVDLKSLSSVAKNALNGKSSRRSMEQLEESILQGMDSILTKMKDNASSEENNESGQVFKIHFEGQSLELLPASDHDNSTMLPPAEIVRELVT